MRVFLFLLFCASAFVLAAQTSPDTYWVQFTNKVNTPYSVDQPEAFLSARSIARRQIQGIPVDELDLPVDPAYIAVLLALGDVTLVNRSRWLNAVTIRTTDEEVLVLIASLPFVQSLRSVRSLRRSLIHENTSRPVGEGVTRGGGELDYGPSYVQVAMMNGHLLHAMEARGEGMLIGVLDSGFEGADLNPALAELYGREGVVLTRDLVDHDGDVYADHWHGRSVLSCMAGVVPGELIGTAIDADYALVRSETIDYELRIEEDNWVSGAELLDSLGCDILNTSLGYTVFDDEEMNYTYADMDGQTARISIACAIAAQKGIVPVVSAGNSGLGDWYHIGAPADAFDILSVGAVDAEGVPADFSSRGPSADGRVKPDVTAMGLGTIGLNVEGTGVGAINGTSFSAPLVAGLVACLWQLHPERTAQDIMRAVRFSAHRYNDPDEVFGYGIPDFIAAHEWLTMTTSTSNPMISHGPSVFPIPFHDQLVIRLLPQAASKVDVALFDAAGRNVASQGVLPTSGGQVVIGPDQLAPLSPGCYFLVIVDGDERWTRTVLKAP